MAKKHNEAFVSVTLQESDWINILYPAMICIEHGLFKNYHDAIDAILEANDQIITMDKIWYDDKNHIFLMDIRDENQS